MAGGEKLFPALYWGCNSRWARSCSLLVNHVRFFVVMGRSAKPKKCGKKALPSGCHLNIRPQFVAEPYGRLRYDYQPFFSHQTKNAVQKIFRGNSDRHINHLTINDGRHRLPHNQRADGSLVPQKDGSKPDEDVFEFRCSRWPISR